MRRSSRLTRALQYAIAVLLVGIAGVVLWSRLVPPRVERLYAQAVEQYRSGDYRSAVSALQRAHQWNPWAVHVNILLGWSYWRSGDARQAENFFSRAHRSEPKSEEAALGLAFSSLALQHIDTALPLFQQLLRKHPNDNELLTGLADAYIKSGQNSEASKLYQQYLDRNPPNPAALRGFLDLYGYEEYRPGLTVAVSPKRQPPQTEIFFRTRGEHLQAEAEGAWRDIYSVGVNIGPARPNEFPSTASRAFATYHDWFKQIGGMNANTVRVYTILPPAFYQALQAYNASARVPLWLVQEIWIEDSAKDLYAAETETEFRQELFSTIDLLHGQADLKYRRGHSYGIYTADVSRWVLGLAVGREIEPRLALNTNGKHASESSYKGRYVSLPTGSPTEAWFARMCDVAAVYEMEHYNAQRPLTVVNWPPLDPMTHSTEANYVDEINFRKKLGEAVPAELPPVINDADTVSLDVSKFKAEPGFEGGIFALYHVYQHWPDFLLHERAYTQASDANGPNRYLGYLQELKKANSGLPLVIGEYGVSTSTAPAHVHPQGWNNGGLTEAQQAELLARFTRNIRDAGCAGGIVFAWQDEWWKHVHDSFTADFERPWDRNPLWDNALDPEKHFGLVGYEPANPQPLLRGQAPDWASARPLLRRTDAEGRPGKLDGIYATSDFEYLYLELTLTPGTVDWNRTNYWIALNTLPGVSGSRRLPGIGVRVEQGVNYLVQLGGPSAGRLLIAQNYNPNRAFPVAGRTGVNRIWRKQGMQIAIANSAPFEDIVIEANPARFARDGTEFPAVNYDRSTLVYGSADRASRDYSSHAAWNAKFARGMIELRIPWGLLLVTDPSQRQVFGGTDQSWTVLSRPTAGISVAAFEVSAESGAEGRRSVLSSLPEVHDGLLSASVPTYTWDTWNEVQFRPYFKASYFALQKAFGQFSAGGSSADRGARHAAR